MSQEIVKLNIKKKDIKKCKRLVIITTLVKSNFFVVLGYHDNGLLRMIKRFNAGQCESKGKTKTTTYTLNIIVQKTIAYIKNYVKIDEGIEIVMKGLEGSGRDFILNAKSELMALSPILSVESRNDAAHGGVFNRRARRV